MVKYRLTLFTLMLFPAFLLAGEFAAHVNKSHVGLDERFALQLTLKDASAQSAPSLAVLKKSFSIQGQQQRSNLAIMNGSTTSSLTWVITLQPQQEGDLTIPSISINTSEGILTTDSIQMHVTAKSPEKEVNEEDGITLTVETSSPHPYKNETFFLTVTLKSDVDLLNIKPPQFSIENAILEPSGQPEIEKYMTNGVKGVTVRFRYLVTPVHAGTLQIPSISIEGATPVTRNEPSRFFDHDFNSVFLMSDFGRLQPFQKVTAPLNLQIQPAVSGMDPWIPARHVALEETWDASQKLQVGEPITRVIKIVAEGALSSQLPDLTAMQSKGAAFKTYADKPVTGNEIKQNSIHSSRLEQYTLIPQQSGPVTLPEIALEWWDVTQNKKAIAVLPARTIEIAPKITSTKNISSDSTSDAQETAEDASVAVGAGMSTRDVLLYGSIICLSLLLVAFMAWVVVLQKKIVKATSPKIDRPHVQEAQQMQQTARITTTIPKPKGSSKDKQEKLPDLNPT